MTDKKRSRRPASPGPAARGPVKTGSLKEVAQRAGTSIPTVSRVLNGLGDQYRISRATQDRVRQAAAALHFSPNLVAKGLSKTLLMSEVIFGRTDTGTWASSGDYRGVIAADSWFHNVAPTFVANLFMTIDTPNSSVADNNWCLPQTDTDSKMPCTGGSRVSGRKAAARSRHSGGVNAVLADGAVRFIDDSIELGVWQALGTMNGGSAEVAIGDF